MKFLRATTALLFTPILALPPRSPQRAPVSRRQDCSPENDPSISAVESAITSWLTDVEAVNAFLNTAPAPGTESYVQLASTTLTRASNEPTQLGVLASICELNSPGVPDYSGAVQTLQDVFSQVPQALQNIVNEASSAGNHATIESNVATINGIRCCQVLPALDVLWLTAAEDYGLVGTVDTTVPRPNACALIECS